MKRVARAFLMALAVGLSSGCGTILNFASGDPEVYGGVQKDIEFVQTPRKGDRAWSGGDGQKWLLPIMAAEISLSFVADTLTLPLAVYLRQNPRPSAENRPPAVTNDQPANVPASSE